MDAERTFQVTADRTERLDRFLADQLDYSRSHAGRLVAAKVVTVNGEVGRASRCLVRGDLVAVSIPQAIPVRQLKPNQIDLNVVHEDDDLLVIDKPAGLVVHPAPGHWDDTLVNALVARGTELSQLSTERPGILHRLDRDTSGLIIVAKTTKAHQKLSRDLAERRIERIYAALSWGHLKQDDETIDAPVARHPHDRKRMTVIATGRRAKTSLHRVARFDDCDLLRVTLETGRTHQIRVHLAHIGHPVLGDAVYGMGGSNRVGPSRRLEARRVEQMTTRQALHAAILRFQHPTSNEPVELRAEWPEDLLPALQHLTGKDGSVARGSALEYLGFFR